jgi:tRNA pseudouridine(55) synthase
MKPNPVDASGPNGVLLIDKAPDMTSHDVVAIGRRALNTKKIGHCGTLDPMATGLLMLVVGRATKIQDLLMSEDKEYVGTLTLGSTTSTQDRQGEVFRISPKSKSKLHSRLSKASLNRCRRWFLRSRKTACRSTNWRAKDKRLSAN